MVQLKYGRGDETQADTLGVRLMSEAGYDPRALLEVMRILAESSGGNRAPEFMSSHPDPGNRREVIQGPFAVPERVPGPTLGRTVGSRLSPRNPMGTTSDKCNLRMSMFRT
jgi:predicted Zn-dependent protease